MDKLPKIYKNKINSIKSKVQNEFYYHANRKSKNINDTYDNSIDSDPNLILNKIENIFQRPDYVYQANVNIMYKNGENKQKKIVGFKKNYLMTLEGDKIYIDDIKDIK